jgi:hypothetical protein
MSHCLQWFKTAKREIRHELFTCWPVNIPLRSNLVTSSVNTLATGSVLGGGAPPGTRWT